MDDAEIVNDQMMVRLEDQGLLEAGGRFGQTVHLLQNIALSIQGINIFAG